MPVMALKLTIAEIQPMPRSMNPFGVIRLTRSSDGSIVIQFKEKPFWPLLNTLYILMKCFIRDPIALDSLSFLVMLVVRLCAYIFLASFS